MSVARKKYSPDEKAMILSLHEQGYTYEQIAEKVRPGVRSAHRSVGEIVRASRRPAPPPAPVGSGVQTQKPAILAPKLKVQLPSSLQGSITAREIMAMLADDQREIFVSTYQDLRGEADEESLTKAENEMLMRAALAHTQYLRAARMYNECESFLIMDLQGEIVDPADPRKRMAGRSEFYKKEMETKHKEYMELIDGLKLKRSQRLDKIKDTRNTFLDLQQELTARARRESIVEEIKQINMKTRDELLRLSKGEVTSEGKKVSWLIGAFDIPKEQNERDQKASPEGEQQQRLEPEVRPEPSS